MPFKDLPEGQTHYYGDNCGNPAHNCKCYSLPYHDKFGENCSCACHFKPQNWKEGLEKYLNNSPYYPHFSNALSERDFRNYLSLFIESLLTAQKEEIVEELKKWCLENWYENSQTLPSINLNKIIEHLNLLKII